MVTFQATPGLTVTENQPETTVDYVAQQIVDGVKEAITMLVLEKGDLLAYLKKGSAVQGHIARQKELLADSVEEGSVPPARKFAQTPKEGRAAMQQAHTVITDQGKTQAQIALASGVSQTQVSRKLREPLDDEAPAAPAKPRPLAHYDIIRRTAVEPIEKKPTNTGPKPSPNARRRTVK